MAKTIVGLFDDRRHVDMLVDELYEEGFSSEDISVILRDADETKDAADLDADDTGEDVVSGTVSGATTGAIVGGIAGLVSAIALPGLGAFLIGGPIAAALGLTGAAAATISGAATGAVAGGLIGGLMGLGLTEEEAEEYEARIKEGDILVAVPVTSESESRVADLFEKHEAVDVKTTTTTSKRVRSEDIEEMAGDDTFSYGVKGGKTKRR